MPETRHDMVDNGMTRVDILTGFFEDAENPTLVELEDAIESTWNITTDGLIGFEPDTGDVDGASLGSKNSITLAGRTNFTGVMLRLKKQAEEDELYDLLQKGIDVTVVVRRDQDAEDDLADGDEVQVVPVQCGEVRRLPGEASGDSLIRFEVPLKIRGRVYPRATIVGG